MPGSENSTAAWQQIFNYVEFLLPGMKKNKIFKVVWTVIIVLVALSTIILLIAPLLYK